MYFDFDDRYSDIEPVGRAINLRDGVVVSVIVHAAIFAAADLRARVPAELPARARPRERQRRAAAAEDRKRRASCSCSPSSTCRRRSRPSARRCRTSIGRRAPSERPPAIEQPAAVRARQLVGAHRVDARRDGRAARARPSNPRQRRRSRSRRPSARSIPNAESRLRHAAAAACAAAAGRHAGRRAAQPAEVRAEPNRSTTRRAAAQEFGPAIQFDTKGVEFGPWIRRFVAQVKRNWFVPVRGDVAARPAWSSRSTCTATAPSPTSP